MNVYDEWLQRLNCISNSRVFIDKGNNRNKLNNNSNMGNTDPHSSYVNMLTHFEKRFIISPHPLDPDENHMFYMH